MGRYMDVAFFATCLATRVAPSNAVANQARANLPLQRAGTIYRIGRGTPLFSHNLQTLTHDVDLLAISSHLFQCNDPTSDEYRAVLKGTDDTSEVSVSRLRAHVKLMSNPISRSAGVGKVIVLISRTGGFDASIRRLKASLSMMSFEISRGNNPMLLGFFNETSAESMIKACLAQYDLSMHYLPSEFSQGMQENPSECYGATTAIGTDDSPAYAIRMKATLGKDFKEVLIFEETNFGQTRIFHASFKLLKLSSLPKDLRESKALASLNERGMCRIFLTTP